MLFFWAGTALLFGIVIPEPMPTYMAVLWILCALGFHEKSKEA